MNEPTSSAGADDSLDDQETVHGAAPDRPRGLVVAAVILGVLVIATAVALVVVLAGGGSDDAPVDDGATSTTSAAPSTTVAPQTSAPTTTAAPEPDVPPAPPSTVAARSVLSEPAGLFCRDLHARGYTYLEATAYWEHHGRPARMDASGMGIPCQTVYPRSDVIERWGESSASVDLNSPYLEHFQAAYSMFHNSSSVERDRVLAQLNGLTSITWTETMFIGLASSGCYDWHAIHPEEGGRYLTEQGIDDWATAIAPVLGISRAAADAAIGSYLWSSFAPCG